ncbi:MAG TPA: hypothetical protein DCP28_08180, partial [Cytophagales bacterium]|nr:hypothetical protein [Cytophagales bacterium]
MKNSTILKPVLLLVLSLSFPHWLFAQMLQGESFDPKSIGPLFFLDKEEISFHAAAPSKKDFTATRSLQARGESVVLVQEDLENLNGASPEGWTGTPALGFSWQVTSSASSFDVGSSSFFFNNFENDLEGNTAWLYTPVMNFSNISYPGLIFDYAYAQYTSQAEDALVVFISKDNGANWEQVFGKSGENLATAEVHSNAFIPTSDEWDGVYIPFPDYAGESNVLIAFGNLGRYGNNIFLDDINIGAGATFEIVGPEQLFFCQGEEITLSVESTGDISAFEWTIYDTSDGSQITIGTQSTISFSMFDFVGWVGASLKAVTPIGDLFITDPQVGSILSSEPLSSFYEGIEDGLNSFPGWAFRNEDGDRTWVFNEESRSPIEGEQSIFGLRNFRSTDYDPAGTEDWMVTPPLDFSDVEPSDFTFYYSYAPYSSDREETLTVYSSVDCGASWQVLWRKTGLELGTVPSQQIEFSPTSDIDDWELVTVSLDAYDGESELYVAMVNTSGGGNNLWIDGITVPGLPLNAAISSDAFEVCQGETISLSDETPNTPEVREWSLLDQEDEVLASGSDSEFSVSTSDLPIGDYRVELKVSNTTFESEISQEVTVNTTTVATSTLEDFEGEVSTTLSGWNSIGPTENIWKFAPDLISAYGEGSYSYQLDLFVSQEEAGTVHRLISPKYNFENTPNPTFTFDYAHAPLGDSEEALEIRLSTDCGASWVTVWERVGLELATAPSRDIPFVPTPEQWTSEELDLSIFSGEPEVLVA